MTPERTLLHLLALDVPNRHATRVMNRRIRAWSITTFPPEAAWHRRIKLAHRTR